MFDTKALRSPATRSGRVDNLPTDELDSRLAELAAHINAATAEFLLLVAEHDRRRAWGHHGCISEAQFLSWRCGLPPHAARDQLAVATDLARVPKIAHASPPASCPITRSGPRPRRWRRPIRNPSTRTSCSSTCGT